MKRTRLAVAGLMLAVLAACSSGGSDAAAAPSEIKADVETINKVAQQLLEVVKANGFDVASVIDKPEFTALSGITTTSES